MVVPIMFEVTFGGQESLQSMSATCFQFAAGVKDVADMILELSCLRLAIPIVFKVTSIEEASTKMPSSSRCSSEEESACYQHACALHFLLGLHSPHRVCVCVPTACCF